MTEDQARDWIGSRWGAVALQRLDVIAAMIREENGRQNLVSASSLETMWSRHIVDSAQLLLLAGDNEGLWVDVGTGGGPPGLMIAALRRAPLMLVEPRRRRADFLSAVVERLQLSHARIIADRIEKVTDVAAVISARAVAQPTKLFELTRAVTKPDTLFLLHGGRDAENGLSHAAATWHGVFHVEQSVTAGDSKIIVAREVRRR